MPSRDRNAVLAVSLVVIAVLLVGAAAWSAAAASNARADAAHALASRNRLAAINSEMHQNLATMSQERSDIVRLSTRHEQLIKMRRANRRNARIIRERRHRRGGSTKAGIQ